MKAEHREKTHGFTLVEVLIVIAIVLVLMAIALPVYFRARHSAWRADEISNLRQLAVAGAIYSEEFGKYPVSTEVLYGGRYGIERLVYSHRDPYPDGYVNAYLSWWNATSGPDARLPLRNHKVTFAGVGDYWPVATMPDHYDVEATAKILSQYEELTTTRQNSGWLISVAEAGAQADLANIWRQLTRPILRLTFEGSVIRRPHCTGKTNKEETAVTPMLCFFDALPGDADL